MGLEIVEEDFYEWYWEVMKPQSPYVIKEGDETKGKKHVLAKGKGKAKAKGPINEEGEDESEVGEGVEATGGENSGAGPSGLAKGKGPSISAKGKGRVAGSEGNVGMVGWSQGGGRVKGVGSKGSGTEGVGLLTVGIPVLLRGSSSSKVDNVIHMLQAKVQHLEYDLGKELDKTEDLHRLTDEVQHLEGALKTEEERTESLAGSKEKYKGVVQELKDMQTMVMDRIRILEAAVGEGEADQRELQRKLEEAQASSLHSSTYSYQTPTGPYWAGLGLGQISCWLITIQILCPSPSGVLVNSYQNDPKSQGIADP